MTKLHTISQCNKDDPLEKKLCFTQTRA